MQKEVWKDITGYEGLYQVSNLSRVKSLDRYKKAKSGKLYIRKGRVLKSIINGSKYYQVCLYKNNTQKIILVHRLVAKAFIPNPDNKPQINHIDNNPSNNNISNLEWTTQSENIRHADKQGRRDFSKFYKPVVGVSLFDGNVVYFKSMNSVSDAGYSAGCVCACIKKTKNFKTHKNRLWFYKEEYLTNRIAIDNEIEKNKEYL